MEKISNSNKSVSGESRSESESQESSSNNEKVSSISDPISHNSENNKNQHEMAGRKKPLHYKKLLEYNPYAEDPKFENLSRKDLPGVISEPGYYDYYADHTPSEIAKLSDENSKPATDQLPETDKLSYVQKALPNSVDLYRPKLADYKEKENRVEEQKENHNNEQRSEGNNEKLIEDDKEEIIEDMENFDEEEKIPNELLNKRNDISNRQIVKRGIINKDSYIHVFISLNNFSDHGSREETGYYGQNSKLAIAI